MGIAERGGVKDVPALRFLGEHGGGRVGVVVEGEDEIAVGDGLEGIEAEPAPIGSDGFVQTAGVFERVGEVVEGFRGRSGEGYRVLTCVDGFVELAHGFEDDAEIAPGEGVARS